MKMNKKLLLILSILMSLSLFTISCAKSVAAPDNPISGITPGQESLTLNDIENALKKIGKFYIQEDPTATGKDLYFDFTTGYFMNTQFMPQIQNNTGSTSIITDQSAILSKLKDALNTINNIAVTFVPNSNWDDTITGLSPRQLTVTVSSSLFKVPNEYKTIIIFLNGSINIDWR